VEAANIQKVGAEPIFPSKYGNVCATSRQPLQMKKVAGDIARPRSRAGKISERTIHANASWPSRTPQCKNHKTQNAAVSSTNASRVCVPPLSMLQ
jgi:hypothetical protein